MLHWFRDRHTRPLIGSLLATALSALLVAGSVIWVAQHRMLEVRLAFAQAEASSLAGLLNGLVARVDQALLDLTLADGTEDSKGCDRLNRAAASLGSMVGRIERSDVNGIFLCAASAMQNSDARLAGRLTPELRAGEATLLALVANGLGRAVLVVGRPTANNEFLAATLNLEPFQQSMRTNLATALEDARGTRVTLGGGGGGTALQMPADSDARPLPPSLANTLPASRAGMVPAGRVVARVSDQLAVTLDLEHATLGDARLAALWGTGWVFLALACGMGMILLVLRLTLVRPLRRLSEQLAGTGGTAGLIGWLGDHPASPLGDLASRIIARDLSHDSQLALREALLREVNHRVAGHLQMVASLLRLQAREDGAGGAADALRRAEHRVNTVALVHQGLQRARQGDTLDLLELIRRLAGNLVEGSPQADTIRLSVEGEALVVPAEHGLPVALVLNEWMTHALQQEAPPRMITIELQRQGTGALLVYRDGGGHPAPERPGHPGLSLSIVEALCVQIGGHCERRPGEGWCLTFPMEAGADA